MYRTGPDNWQVQLEYWAPRILGALAILLMRQRGYSWERMLETHPGGAVGKMGARPEALEPIR